MLYLPSWTSKRSAGNISPGEAKRNSACGAAFSLPDFQFQRRNHRLASRNRTQHPVLRCASRLFKRSVGNIIRRCKTERSIRSCIQHFGLSRPASETSADVAIQNAVCGPAFSISVFQAWRRRRRPWARNRTQHLVRYSAFRAFQLILGNTAP